jgi:hypothetical protein
MRNVRVNDLRHVTCKEVVRFNIPEFSVQLPTEKSALLRLLSRNLNWLNHDFNQAEIRLGQFLEGGTA